MESRELTQGDTYVNTKETANTVALHMSPTDVQDMGEA